MLPSAKNGKLRRLKIRDNPIIDGEGVKQLQTLIEQSTDLSALYIIDIEVTDEKL